MFDTLTRWIAAAAAFTLALLATPVAANAADDDEPEHARPSIVLEHERLIAGRTNTIAVRFEIDEGWHLYWNGRNDTGFAPVIGLSLPEGFTAGETLWPAPHRYTLPGEILDHIYEGELLLLIPLEVPASAAGRTVELAAELEWLVCAEVCIPGFAEISRTVRVAPADHTPAPSAHFEAFERARLRLPEPLPADARDVEIALSTSLATIVARRPVAAMHFYPEQDSAEVRSLLRAGTTTSRTLELPLEDAAGERLRGVLELELGNGARPRLYAIDLRVP